MTFWYCSECWSSHEDGPGACARCGTDLVERPKIVVTAEQLAAIRAKGPPTFGEKSS